MIKEFVIDRAKWLRGEGTIASRLLREGDGKMCCLGVYLRACGFEDYKLSGKGAPFSVGGNVPKWLFTKSNGCKDNSDVCYQLMSMNDARFETDEAREAFIKEKFAEQGIDVTFVG